MAKAKKRREKKTSRNAKIALKNRYAGYDNNKTIERWLGDHLNKLLVFGAIELMFCWS
jgi:hypothetical protein